MEIESCECTCIGCPTSYEGKLKDGRIFYFRFRWGHATLKVSKEPTDDIWDAVEQDPIYSEQLSDSLDGVMEHDQAMEIINRELSKL